MRLHAALLVVPVVALALAGCASFDRGTHSAQSKPEAAQQAPAKHLAHGRQTAHGSFRGASKHVTTGTVGVFQDGNHWVISLADDFSFDGAPAPRVGLGKGGRYDPKTQVSALQSNHGPQTYVLAASVDVGKYDEVYIWCEQFNVPLGVAKLTLN